MASSSSMRQLEERHIASKVELMKWCHKMDLLALSNVRGEVALHRLTWQKVWTLAPPTEGTTVVGMAWRPDGKVIAIAYSSSEILLIDVENKETLHTTRVEGEISCIAWVQEKDQLETKPVYSHKQKEPQCKYFNQDSTCNFLPKLPSLSRSFGSVNKNIDENLEDAKKIREQSHLNILLVGLITGKLYLSVFGLFPCGVIDLSNYVDGRQCSIVDADISEDLNKLLVILACPMSKKEGEKQRQELTLVLLDTPVLACRSAELHALALKHGHIVSLLGYLSQTMHSITEAWENILLEMDSKLALYAAKVPEGSVSADFLDLLMLGTPSDQLETFLLQDLTEKGLKKLGHTIELSYSNIQKLVLKHLHSVGQSLAYHLTELRGMSRWRDRYQVLGLSESSVDSCLIAAGAFLVKTTEVQQVIDNSIKNYKAFFRWLYVVILRLTDERVPPEITKITQQDLSFIAEFLLHFDGLVAQPDESNHPVTVAESPPKLKFNLEMLGQYLQDQNLTMPPHTKNNPWPKFLEENYDLAAHPSCIPHFKDMSLVQQHNHLISAIENVFSQPDVSIGQLFKVAHVTNCLSTLKIGKPTLTHVNQAKDKLLLVFLDSATPADGFYFLQVSTGTTTSTKCAYYHFKCPDKKAEEEGKAGEAGSSTLKVLDVQFYSVDILSVLLLQHVGENRTTVFLQFPTRTLVDHAFPVALSCAPRVEATALLEGGALRPVENMVASRFAVSGSRKVAVVLAESCQKVRLFEMEAEEEEEDDDAMEATMSTTKDSDTSTVLDVSKSSDVNEDV